MEKEIDLFAEQPISNLPQDRVENPIIPNNPINHTEIKAFYDVFAPEKEMKVCLINKGTILFQSSGSGTLGVLQNKDGLRCMKVVDEKGKTRKNPATGITLFESLEDMDTYLNKYFNHYKKGKRFSTPGSSARQTKSPARK